MSKKSSDTLPTIWRVPDLLWCLVERVLLVYDPKPVMGRPRINQRDALDGIIYRMRTGCQWNHLPREFGDDASSHRTMQRWEALGIFDIIWAVLISKCEELGAVPWQWQSADAMLGKARGVPKKETMTMLKTLQQDSTRKNASAQAQPTVAKRVSRKACLSKEEACRLHSA